MLSVVSTNHRIGNIADLHQNWEDLNAGLGLDATFGYLHNYISAGCHWKGLNGSRKNVQIKMEDYIKPRDIVLCGNFSFKFLIGFLLYTGCPIKSFPI